MNFLSNVLFTVKVYRMSKWMVIMGLLIGSSAYGQVAVDSLHQPKVFVVSGMGFGFPIGKTQQTLSPKFSSSLGLNVPTKSNLFFYPVVDFLRLGYDQQSLDEHSSYAVQNGTANIYGFSFMPGINRFLGSVKLYAYAGPSVQWVHEPRSRVSDTKAQVTIEKVKYFTGGTRAGVGAHYKIGNFYLFIEGSWIHNFHDMQHHAVDIAAVYGGLKTDVTDLVRKLGAL